MNARRTVRAAAAGLAVLLATMGASSNCGGKTETPAPPAPKEQTAQQMVDQRMAECGTGCHLVEVRSDLTDADGQLIPLAEGWEAEWVIETYQRGPNDVPVPTPMIDFETGQLIETPYERSVPLPSTVYLILPADVIGAYVSIDVFLHAGFTMRCTMTEGGLPIDDGEVETPLPLDKPDGLPVDQHLFLVWPVGFAIPL